MESCSGAEHVAEGREMSGTLYKRGSLIFKSSLAIFGSAGPKP